MAAVIALLDNDYRIKIIDKSSINADQFHLTRPLVNKLLPYFLPDNSIIISDGLVPEEKKEHQFDKLVANLSGYERIILDCESTRCWQVLDNFKHDLPCYATTSIINYYNTNHPQIKFFPWLFILANLTLMPYEETTRSHKFSCLNANQWNHRKLAYIWLYDKPYFKDIIYSWGRISYQVDLPEDTINDLRLSEEEKQKLKELPAIISTHEKIATGVDTSNNHPAYSMACLNIITETQSRVDTPFLTEKTVKPLISEQFFLLVGQPTCIQFLRNIGFDVFDDIIDHSYDLIFDDRERIKAVIKEIDRLEKLDLFKLYYSCKHRLRYNREFMNSQELKNKLLSSINFEI